MALPDPHFDMDDGHASDWLMDLADSYSGADRLNVRSLAMRLRARHRATLEAERARMKAKRDRVAELEANVDDLEGEVRRAQEDLDEARRNLAEEQQP
jgi:predicted  nucleic acid-binding Zn-ribbon protein